MESTGGHEIRDCKCHEAPRTKSNRRPVLFPRSLGGNLRRTHGVTGCTSTAQSSTTTGRCNPLISLRTSSANARWFRKINGARLHVRSTCRTGLRDKQGIARPLAQDSRVQCSNAQFTRARPGQSRPCMTGRDNCLSRSRSAGKTYVDILSQISTVELS